MRKKIEIKNLIRNNRYIILSKGEGGHSPLLHTGYPQKRNGHRHDFTGIRNASRRGATLARP